MRLKINAPPLQGPADTPTDESRHKQSDYVGAGLAINGLLALATFILAIVGICQARAARDAADEAKRQAETLDKTLVVTQRAAEAAKDSAEATRGALMLNIRGRIQIYPGSLQSQGDTLYLSVGIINAGGTKAKIITQGFYGWLQQTGVVWPPELSVAYASAHKPLPDVMDSQMRKGEVWPVRELQKQKTSPNGESDWLNFVNGVMLACIAGIVVYEDEGGHAHTTHFCQAWDQAKKKFFIPEGMPSLYNFQS